MLSGLSELFPVQRRRGCWMFGVPGRCGAWSWLIGLSSSFAAVDFILALATGVSGRESMDSSQAKKRCLPNPMSGSYARYVNADSVIRKRICFSAYQLM